MKSNDKMKTIELLKWENM